MVCYIALGSGNKINVKFNKDIKIVFILLPEHDNLHQEKSWKSKISGHKLVELTQTDETNFKY